MLVLGIESSCDETAAAVVISGRQVLSNVISSQVDLHAIYGGVVPELACRRHIDVIIPIIDEALKIAGKQLKELDLIAVTQGPGLVGALLIGLNAAKGLSLALNIPFIGVNHVEAHLYAAMMSHSAAITFPCLGAVLSGGHTALVEIRAIGEYRLISQTVDDAIGEAFDKVAKILSLPYPGGPYIEKLAAEGNPHSYPFKAGHVKKLPLHFSFSGLKTAVLYTVKEISITGAQLSHKQRCDIAASFQLAAFSDISKKIATASELLGSKEVLFGGGVVNNLALRAFLKKRIPNLNCLWPTVELTLDNAAMIAGLGYQRYISQASGDFLNLEAIPGLTW